MSIRTLPPVLLDDDQRGAALIEMTMVIPLLLTIGLGVFEFGNIYYKYHLMENAVRDGGRYASSLVGNVCANTTAGSTLRQMVVDTVKKTGAANQVWTTGTTITVTCASYNNKANNYAYRGGDTINSVIVTAKVPYQSLGLLGFFNLVPPTLQVSHEERLLGGR